MNFSYLYQHTQGKIHGRAHSKKRNTYAMAENWREEIGENQLKIIEKVCKNTLHVIGHNIFGSLKAVRNKSLPLVMK